MESQLQSVKENVSIVLFHKQLDSILTEPIVAIGMDSYNKIYWNVQIVTDTKIEFGGINFRMYRG